MKSKNFKQLLLTYFLLLLITGFNACNKDDNTNPSQNTIQFSASLDASQETPPTGESGTGTCTATYDVSTNKLTFNLNWTNLTDVPVAMHFHKAKFGESGDVEIPITGFPSAITGSLSGTATVDQDEEGDLLEDKFYVNIHTALHPSGEIRGQLIQQ